MSLVDRIVYEIENDDEDNSEDLVTMYQRAPLEEQLVLDNMMMFLCGRSMKTLIEKEHLA